MIELILVIFLLVTFKASGIWWGLFGLAVIIDMLLALLREAA